MKKLLTLALILGLSLPVLALAEEKAAAAKEFGIYSDRNAKDNH